jgi:hypothetical protein
MYNVFKRPMFKLGGQADQGSGIMSHVEPRQNYMFGNIAQPLTPFQTAYSDLQVQGYAMGGQIGGGTISGNPTPNGRYGFQNPRLVDLGGGRQVPTSGVTTKILPQSFLSGMETFGKNTMPAINYLKKGISNPLVAGGFGTTLAAAPFFLFEEDPLRNNPKEKDLQTTAEKLQEQYYGQPRRRLMEDVTSGTRSKAESPYTGFDYETAKREAEAAQNKYTGADELGTNEEGLAFATGINPRYRETLDTDKNKNIDTNQLKDEPISKGLSLEDKKARIKEEAGFIKELLGNEDLTKAEMALVLGKALGTPGGINAKIAAAGELALPIARAKSKQDKEAVLKAYEAYREREKADIAASKPSDSERAIMQQAVDIKNSDPKDKRSLAEIRAQLRNDNIFNKGDAQLARQEALTLWKAELPTITNLYTNIQKAEYKQKVLKQKLSPEEQQDLDLKKQTLNMYRGRYPDQFAKYFSQGYVKGGRVKLAEGDLVDNAVEEDANQDTVEQSVVESDGQTIPMKPVVGKLSFQDLRNRLPQEITNDVVLLLSRSQDALQDFAYIKTQQDVNQFNIKYGVNLVLPSTT